MRWVTYLSSIDRAEHAGLLKGDTVHGLADDRRLVDLLGDGGELLTAAARQIDVAPFEIVPVRDVRLLAPVPVPPSVRDFMSFEEHVVTSMKAIGHELAPSWYEDPVFYFSNPAAVRGPYEDVAISPGSLEFDFELEVAAIIGLGGSDIAPDEAEKHIAGYTVLCDWSARDLQRREMQQTLGPAKGKDSATTIGPALVTPDEINDHRAGNGFGLRMRASVNGQPYSDGSWSTIYWSFEQMITYASRGTRLVPGDVIGSGTVGSGCILELSRVHGKDKFPFLRPGDDVSLEIEGLGGIRSTILPGVTPIALI
jgi:2-keto-4-pentenoate hydratase/2-oxohepta-3-ene-1,7-dioic acid hydratase in catechol pathway